MLTSSIESYLRNRKAAMNKINQAVVEALHKDLKIDFEILYNPEPELPNIYEEFITITYLDNNFSTICCTGNTISYCVKLLGELLSTDYHDDDGYYIKTYNKYELLI